MLGDVPDEREEPAKTVHELRERCPGARAASHGVLLYLDDAADGTLS
jgi:hypothetical protein